MRYKRNLLLNFSFWTCSFYPVPYPASWSSGVPSHMSQWCLWRKRETEPLLLSRSLLAQRPAGTRTRLLRSNKQIRGVRWRFFSYVCKNKRNQNYNASYMLKETFSHLFQYVLDSSWLTPCTFTPSPSLFPPPPPPWICTIYRDLKK